jgi:hypothetical protein
MDNLSQAIELLNCLDNGMGVDIKEGDINRVDMKGVLITPELMERVHNFLNKINRKPHPIRSRCPECRMLSIFGHQPHIDGCSRPAPIIEE